MFRGPWLGQVPLVVGPSSSGAAYGPSNQRAYWDPEGTPPYFGEWGIPDGEGFIVKGGRVGPYDTSDEAFNAAVAEAKAAGARKMPLDGFAQVKDSQGQVVGPII